MENNAHKASIKSKWRRVLILKLAFGTVSAAVSRPRVGRETPKRAAQPRERRSGQVTRCCSGSTILYSASRYSGNLASLIPNPVGIRLNQWITIGLCEGRAACDVAVNGRKPTQLPRPDAPQRGTAVHPSETSGTSLPTSARIGGLLSRRQRGRQPARVTFSDSHSLRTKRPHQRSPRAPDAAYNPIRARP
jgi:hypothetical protein